MAMKLHDDIDPGPEDELVVEKLRVEMLLQERWELTELGRKALRDATPTGFPLNGNPVGVDEQPPAYIHGYADGKSKAHFEIRYRTSDHDPQVCGCEPCITVRVALARFNLWPHGLAPNSDADHPDYPGYKVCRGCGGPDDGHFPDCVVQLYEKRREATPQEARRIDQWVAENATVITPVAGCPENDGGVR